jgi:hypothetical protein
VVPRATLLLVCLDGLLAQRSGRRQSPAAKLHSHLPSRSHALGRRGAAHARVPRHWLVKATHRRARVQQLPYLVCGPEGHALLVSLLLLAQRPGRRQSLRLSCALDPAHGAQRADHAQRRGGLGGPSEKNARVANAGSMDLMKILSAADKCSLASGQALDLCLTHPYGGSSLAHAHVGPGGGRDGHGCKATGFRSRRGGGEEGELRAETLAASRP